MTTNDTKAVNKYKVTYQRHKIGSLFFFSCVYPGMFCLPKDVLFIHLKLVFCFVLFFLKQNNCHWNCTHQWWRRKNTTVQTFIFIQTLVYTHEYTQVYFHCRWFVGPTFCASLTQPNSLSFTGAALSFTESTTAPSSPNLMSVHVTFSSISIFCGCHSATEFLLLIWATVTSNTLTHTDLVQQGQTVLWLSGWH